MYGCMYVCRCIQTWYMYMYVHVYRLDTCVCMYMCTVLLDVWRTVRQTSVELRTLFSFFTDCCQAFGRHKRSRCRETLRSSVSARTCQEKQKLLKKFHLRKESIFASLQKEKQTWSQSYIGLKYTLYCNMTSFFRFVDKRAIYRWYNLIRTCAGKCDWLFHWQHKLCATFFANVNINYRLLSKVYVTTIFVLLDISESK